MFNKEIKLDNSKVVKKPFDFKIIYILIFVVFLLLAWKITEFNLGDIAENYDQFFKMIGDMLPPFGDPEAMKEYFEYTFEIWPELITTLQISILGTVFGTMLAFPVAIMASVNISNKVVSAVTKFILSIIRTIPVLVYASLFVFTFGLGEVAGLVAVTLFTFSIATKMFYEIIERADMGPYEAGISSGLSPYKSFLLTIKPQVMPAFYSICLYSLEINVKSATVLGYVNAGGIGLLLKDAMSVRHYDEVGLIIFYTIILVIAIDFITQIVRKKMIDGSSRKKSMARTGISAGFLYIIFAIIYSKFQVGYVLFFFIFAAIIIDGVPGKVRGGKYLAWLFVVLAVIWSLFGIDFNGFPEDGFMITLNIITSMLKPSLDIILNFTSTGLLFLLIQTLMIAFLGTFIGAMIGAFLAILGSNNLTPSYIHKPIRLFLSVIRTIPAIIFGIMAMKMTGPGPFAGVVTFAVLSIGMIGKLIIEDIEELSKGLDEVASVAGLTWFKKIRFIIIPQIFNSIVSIYIYRFEINLRDAATLGLIGAGGIGYPLLSSINNQKWSDAGAYLFGLMIIVLLVDYFSTKLRAKLK